MYYRAFHMFPPVRLDVFLHKSTAFEYIYKSGNNSIFAC